MIETKKNEPADALKEMKPIFVLGIGAQKAGTSWLYGALSKQRNVNFGLKKEYHIWDAKFNDLMKGFKSDIKNPVDAGEILISLMQNDDDVYGRYFKSLIKGEVCITGDITPSYSSLGSNDFFHIKKLLVHYGFNVKVIFLLRDPLERIWSALRMGKRNAERNGKEITEDELIQNLIHSIDAPQHQVRGNYLGTIANVERQFSSSEIHYELYENLFTARAVSALGDFLGFELKGLNFDTRINASPQVALPQEIQDEAREKLKEQYLGCYKKFPLTKDLWHNLS